MTWTVVILAIVGGGLIGAVIGVLAAWTIMDETDNF